MFTVCAACGKEPPKSRRDRGPEIFTADDAVDKLEATQTLWGEETQGDRR